MINAHDIPGFSAAARAHDLEDGISERTSRRGHRHEDADLDAVFGAPVRVRTAADEARTAAAIADKNRMSDALARWRAMSTQEQLAKLAQH